MYFYLNLFTSKMQFKESQRLCAVGVCSSRFESKALGDRGMNRIFGLQEN